MGSTVGVALIQTTPTMEARGVAQIMGSCTRTPANQETQTLPHKYTEPMGSTVGVALIQTTPTMRARGVAQIMGSCTSTPANQEAQTLPHKYTEPRLLELK